MMSTATAMAAMGSRYGQPVTLTSSRPKATPNEVYTSVSRWAASASSAADSVRRATG